MTDIGHVGHEPLTDNIGGFDGDRRRKNACEKSVQRAAMISTIAILITLMMESSLATVIYGVMVMDMKGNCGRHTLRAGQW